GDGTRIGEAVLVVGRIRGEKHVRGIEGGLVGVALVSRRVPRRLERVVVGSGLVNRGLRRRDIAIGLCLRVGQRKLRLPYVFGLRDHVLISSCLGVVDRRLRRADRGQRLR